MVRAERRFVASVLALSAVLPLGAAIPPGDWHSNGREVSATRASPLTQITPGNVAGLTRAWNFTLKPADDPAPRLQASNQTPLAVDGIVFIATPYNRVVALDGDSGRVAWTYVLPGGDAVAGRAMEYWAGDARHPARIFFGTRDGKLLAVDAKTGQPPADFVAINLKTPEVMAGSPDGFYTINSAPILWKNVLITASRNQETPARGPNGDVRGWDAATGKLLWTFHSIPQPGERGHETWDGDGWKERSGVNVWTLMSVDGQRGLVFLPFGAPTYDRAGVDHPGANLYANSIVAVDARTGKYRWHYQAVHHDIWDLDLPMQPALFDVKRGGRTIPAIAVASKQGLVFILDRTTGKPIFPTPEVPVPPSTIPGEKAWPTQPIPSAPPPLMRQSMSEADIPTLTPELQQACLDRVRTEQLTFDAPFTPLRTDHATVRMAGSGGGVNWGGAAFDATRGYLIVNSNAVGGVERLGQNSRGEWMINSGKPIFWQVRIGDARMMCSPTPWGSLTAIDVSKGTFAWQVPLGVTDALPAALQRTGRPNVGGPTVTASGLVFIGATDDARLRAFDAATGAELWADKLPAAAHTTPIVYRGRSGREYIAVVAAGGSYLADPVSAGELIVYALPAGKR